MISQRITKYENHNNYFKFYRLNACFLHSLHWKINIHTISCRHHYLVYYYISSFELQKNKD